MKYKQAVPRIKNKVREFLKATKVVSDLTRYSSGGGGATLTIVAWTSEDPGAYSEALLRDELLPKWLRDLEVDDLHVLWHGLSIHLIVRQDTFPTEDAIQWRHIRK